MSVWNEVVREIESFTADIGFLRVTEPLTPESVRRDVESMVDFQRAIPLDELTRRVAVLLRQYTTHITHPRYFGLFNPSVTTAGIVADTLAALYNPQLATWSHAPAANEIERATLRHLAAALGLDPSRVFANFTSGGAEANMSAVLVALAHRFPEIGDGGLCRLGAPPLIYVTSESHHSFVKIARMTGLGSHALCEVPVGPNLTLDVPALSDRMDADARAGRMPLMVVGTAGTTGGGFIDPLESIAALAAERGVWFHVDAAWGGAAVLVPRLRPALRGIERADSITWDAHKWLSAPMGAGMFFCRHAEAVQRAFALTTSYMPPSAGEDFVEPYATTMQWSRRAIGLKVFMTIAELGWAGVSARLDRQTVMGERLRERLRAAGWSVVNETVLPLVCFTHPDIIAGSISTGMVLDQIYARGRVWISDVVLGGRERVLRACITSYRTEDEDLACLIDEIERGRLAAAQSRTQE
jgi:glutamate/tyrosine decarboxylase-like PLP-dependent enzyme